MPPLAYTLLGALFSATEKLCEDKGVSLHGARWILEGFGKVGAELVRQFQQKGMRLLAISTRSGALYNPRGLDGENLLALQHEWGDDCVKHTLGNEEVTLDQMLQLETDILILAGKPEALHVGNVNEVKADIVVPGGNLSISSDAEEALAKQGYVILPDFVTNSGGSIRIDLEWDWSVREGHSPSVHPRIRKKNKRSVGSFKETVGNHKRCSRVCRRGKH